MEIAKAMMHLQDLGVKQVIIRYSGSGDSGQIDDIFYIRSSDDEESSTDIGVNDTVHSIIESRSYTLLNPIEDWYNNEGGYGTIKIEVPSGEYHIENNINIVNVETYEHEGQLEDKA